MPMIMSKAKHTGMGHRAWGKVHERGLASIVSGSSNFHNFGHSNLQIHHQANDNAPVTVSKSTPIKPKSPTIMPMIKHPCIKPYLEHGL